MRLGIIGCGNITRHLIQAICDGYLQFDEIYVYDRNEDRCNFDCLRTVFASPKDMTADLFVEAASQEAVREYGEELLKKGDLVVMSVGALLDKKLRSKLITVAKESGHKLIIPSGAVGCTDLLKSLKRFKKEVTLVTTKNPKSLGTEVSERTVLFEGSAEEAVKRFPANVNVVATLVLASEAEVKVKIIADPNVTTNVHEVFVKSEIGNYYCRFENIPSKLNPKTSALAPASLIEALRELSEDDALIILP